MASYEKTGTPGVFKRARRDGSYTYSVAMRDPATKRVKFHTAGSSLSDAKALKRKLEDAKAQGQQLPDSKFLLPMLWDEFEENHLSTLAVSTQNDARSAWNRYIHNRFRRTALSKLDSAELMAFRTHLARVKSSRGTNLSPRRQRNVFLVLQGLLSFGVATGRISSNPAQRLQRGPKLPEANRRAFLTQAQQVLFLDAVSEVNPDPLYRTLCHLMLHSGARVSEAIAARRGQLDLTRRTFLIDRSVHLNVEKSTKSGRERTVGISNSLLAALEVYLERIPDDSEALIFPNRKGGGRHLDVNSFRRNVFDRAVERCAAKDPTFPQNFVIHSLRHTYASMLVGSTTPVSMLQCRDLLGHSSVAVSEIYAHADRDQTVAASIAALG